MKIFSFVKWSGPLLLGTCLVSGQDAIPTETEQLRRQLQEATENFEKSAQEYQKVIRDLQQRLEELEKKSSATSTNQALAQPSETSPPADPELPLASQTAETGETAPTQPWRPTDPIRFRRGSAYIDVGLVGTFAVGGSTAEDIAGGTQLGGHDPNQRGFTLQGVEATFSGAVDPYFQGLATINFNIDAHGETRTELEEAYLESLSLPVNLQLRAGQYFTEFGRHNLLHLHSWHFVDMPLINGRLLGPDGLRNPGARLSWLTPTPFYSELFLSVQNSQGVTASSFRFEGEDSHGHGEEEDVPFAYREAENDRGVQHLDDMLYGPGYVASFDVADAHVLLLGASAAFGPNASGGEMAGETRTQIYGADFTWKWKSPRHAGGFPFVQWQSEAMWRRYDAGRFSWDLNNNGALDPGEIADPITGQPALLPGETIEDYGLYTQCLYGFRKGWVAGLRFDYVTSSVGDYEQRGLTLDGEVLRRDPARAMRWRLSPNLTWYLTEFSKFRLQYNYDWRKGIGQDHSVWLQFEFVLGAHAAHTF